jgi:hypothetical protein
LGLNEESPLSRVQPHTRRRRRRMNLVFAATLMTSLVAAAFLVPVASYGTSAIGGPLPSTPGANPPGNVSSGPPSAPCQCAPPGWGPPSMPVPPPGMVLLGGAVSVVDLGGGTWDSEEDGLVVGAPGSSVSWNFSIMWAHPNGTQASSLTVISVELTGANLTGMSQGTPLIVPFGHWVTMSLQIGVPNEPDTTVTFPVVITAD